MKLDEYLQMVNAQLNEAKENMELTEKSYREAKAKYDGILSFKEKYIQWIGEKDDERKGI